MLRKASGRLATVLVNTRMARSKARCAVLPKNLQVYWKLSGPVVMLRRLGTSTSLISKIVFPTVSRLVVIHCIKPVAWLVTSSLSCLIKNKTCSIFSGPLHGLTRMGTRSLEDMVGCLVDSWEQRSCYLNSEWSTFSNTKRLLLQRWMLWAYDSYLVCRTFQWVHA
jgi:hypothetical protein